MTKGLQEDKALKKVKTEIDKRLEHTRVHWNKSITSSTLKSSKEG